MKRFVEGDERKQVALRPTQAPEIDPLRSLASMRLAAGKRPLGQSPYPCFRPFYGTRNL
jgi:hypothetical protein